MVATSIDTATCPQTGKHRKIKILFAKNFAKILENIDVIEANGRRMSSGPHLEHV